MKKEKLKIFIVDDDIAFQRILELSLNELGFKDIYFASRYEEALSSYPEVNPDFAFIDIHILGYENGIDLAKELIDLKKIPFTFITSDFIPGTYERAKEVAPNGFLSKDFSPLELLQTIELSYLGFPEDQESEPDLTSDKPILDESFLFIKLGPVLHRIKFEDILYFQTAGNYAEVVTQERKFLTNYSVKQVYSLVPKEGFIRINQSQLVNKDKIKQVNTERNEVLIGNNKFPVSRKYKKEMMNKISSF